MVAPGCPEGVRLDQEGVGLEIAGFVVELGADVALDTGSAGVAKSQPVEMG